jgi:hypothetical protein
MKISQSLIKAYSDYTSQKLCGDVFKRKYIDKDLIEDPTDAMKKGMYFEYLCTGQLPKNGVVPQPELTAKGELTAEYKRVKTQAENFHKYLLKMKIQIIDTGKHFEKNGLEGTTDIIALWNKEEIVIDLKLSGLLYDKWADFGWAIDSLQYKEKLMIQAVQYEYLTGLPFYFFVFSSTNEDDCELIRVEIDKEVFTRHLLQIDKIKSMIELDLNFGFNNYPELVRCKKCPLFSECTNKTEVPLIKTVHYL